jgi:glycosyltransferase involved in cell wall biosynthesis
MTQSIPEVRNPYNPQPNYGLLFFRWSSLALLMATAVTGRELLAWLSLPILGLLLITSWGLHVAFVENLKNLHRLTPESGDGDDREDLPGVAVVVPSRNEEVAIESAVRSLGALDYPNVEILIVDGQSTDATPQILERLARDIPRIRVFQEPPLEDNWMGRPNAMWFGVRQADPSHRWLLFTDADVVFHPKALRRAVAYAESHQIDFLTCIPFLLSGSLLEHLVTPWAWTNLVYAARSDRPGARAAPPVGVGAFMLVRRDVYFAAGGHAAIHDSAFDETMLARAVGENGGKTAVAWTSALLKVRRYYGYRHMRERLVPWIRSCAGDLVSHQAGQLAWKLLLLVAPLPLAIAGIVWQVARHGFSPALSAFSLLAFLVYVDRIVTLERFRAICQIRRGVSWLHPLGGLMRSWFEAVAIAESLRGKRALWRGRPFTIPRPSR